MHAHQGVANFAAGVTLLQKVGERVKVSERFRHLLAIDQQMRAMQPVTDEFFSGDAFALRDLRFVMRENVIDATAMDVDLIAKQRRRHRAAFDVPTRPAAAPRAFPRHIAVFFVPGFPKREVADVFLVVFVVLYATG